MEAATAEREEEWQRPEYEPTAAENKRKQSAEENAAAAEARVAAVVAKARAEGTTHVSGEVVVRRVDPASIRPAGWKPVKLPPGASAVQKREAILDYLERGPRSLMAIRKALELSPADNRFFNQLESQGLVYRTGDTEKTNGPQSPVIALVEEADELPEPPEPVKPDRTDGEVSTPEGPPAVEPPVAPDSNQEVDVAPDELEADPDEVECALDTCSERFVPHRKTNIYHSVRCEEEAARLRRGGHRGFRERECALEPETVGARELPGCTERFTPTAPREMYHSQECRQEANRRQKAAHKRRARARGRQETRKEKDAVSDARTAEAAGQPPADEDTPTGMRQRYVELLFGLVDRDPGRTDLLDRLDNIATDGNGLCERYANTLAELLTRTGVQGLDERLFALAERHPTPAVLDAVESAAL